tara:strand:- start:110 stop:778 length:669 start_codon:yes stop_codon:yes gene_type:complete
MHTKFILSFDTTVPDLDLVQFNKSLPSKMKAIEKTDGIYIQVESGCQEDERCQYLVDRELDRHRYLTAVNIKAAMVKRTVTKSLVLRWRVHAKLPDNIQPQVWDSNLATQFRLWNLASDTDDNMLKVILYFQIIELTYPTPNYFPKYFDSTEVPNPLTESKFVRNLVAHSGEVGSTQLKHYCEYLGIPDLMFDPTKLAHMEIIKSKVNLLETEAKKVIEAVL